MGIIQDTFKSWFDNINRVNESFEQKEGILDIADDIRFEMSDEELIDLKKDWEKKGERLNTIIQKKQKENELYWMGTPENGRKNKIDNRPIADNLIFESLETFLPIATRGKLEPVVYADNSTEGEALSKDVTSMIAYHIDRLRFNLKLKNVVRNWALYLLGVGKVSWNLNENDINFEAIKPQKLLLDPDEFINDDMEYTGEFIGEYKKESASKLIKRFPKKEKEIKKAVNDKMGTKIVYTEWWTNEYLFWTFKNIVLGKVKNPHWNYTGESTVDEMGQEIQTEARNHFTVPKKPYVFLSVFNLKRMPYDETSLIGQNLSNQDIVNKLQDQIVSNVRFMNNGYVVSSEFTKEQAGRVAKELLNVGVIQAPNPNASNAIFKIPANPLPADVFNERADIRNEMRNIFGIRGSSPQGIVNENTVRGKVIISQQDSSRISGISEYLEQFADNVFNWFVQMMMVYYDEPHVASIIGTDKAREYITLSKSDFDRKISVSVKEGSLMPKDQLTQANQAMDLAQMGIIDPITALEKLNYPDPKKTAERTFLYKSAPQLLFPEAGQSLEQEQQKQMIMQQEQSIEQAQTQQAINQQGVMSQAEAAKQINQQQ